MSLLCEPSRPSGSNQICAASFNTKNEMGRKDGAFQTQLKPLDGELRAAQELEIAGVD